MSQLGEDKLGSIAGSFISPPLRPMEIIAYSFLFYFSFQCFFSKFSFPTIYKFMLCFLQCWDLSCLIPYLSVLLRLVVLTSELVFTLEAQTSSPVFKNPSLPYERIVPQ